MPVIDIDDGGNRWYSEPPVEQVRLPGGTQYECPLCSSTVVLWPSRDVDGIAIPATSRCACGWNWSEG